MNGSSKICKYCGRDFEWRKKWEKTWDQVKFCSSKCSNQNMSASMKIEGEIIELLKTRGHQKSICPSEVLNVSERSDKIKMEKVRCAARRLANKGEIVITQKNKSVNPSSFKGPIRLRLA